MQLLGSSLYLDELNDRLRNENYHEALVATVRPGDHILDIGTGSGLLSCLAVKALQAQGAESMQPIYMQAPALMLLHLSFEAPFTLVRQAVRC